MATRVVGFEAIELAERKGWTLCKRAEPPPGEGARDGLTPEEARAVARRDPSLIYVDFDEIAEGSERLA